MHHFFVSPDRIDIEKSKVYIDGTDVNHIKNVLRMKKGEEMLISDGEGNDYVCCIEEFDEKNLVVADIIDKNFEGTELASKIYLFQGLPKSDKMELIIQKAVELGVYKIIPVSTKRTIVKLDGKKEEAKIRRFNEIAKSAAKQSRRSIIPEVCKVMSFKEALDYAKEFDMNIIPYENYKDMTETKKVMKKIKKDISIGIFIGPEGGFDEKEIELAVEQNVDRISLGKRILRTETAGLMIVSVIMFAIEE